MKIDAKTYQKLPDNLKTLFQQSTNMSREEVVSCFPQASGAVAAVKGTEPSSKTDNAFGQFAGRAQSDRRDGGGSAARFFYCAKASKSDRDQGLDDMPDRVLAMSNQAKAELARGNMHEGESGMNTAKVRKNNHPTVKPTDLMAYLCRLITPPGGVVLDPFMGSGSTGKAAMREGFQFVGIEMEAQYMEIATARIEHELSRVEAERDEALKAKAEADAQPLQLSLID